MHRMRAAIVAMVSTATVAQAQCMYEVIELPVPDCGPIPSSITVEDMNIHGAVVGRWRTCDLNAFAIYYWTPEDGHHPEFSLPPGAAQAYAKGVNDKGHMTGRAVGPDGHQFGWAWIDGRYITIPIPDGQGNGIEAMAINNHDQIVGWLGVGPLGERHPFLWEDGELTLLDDIVGSSNACAQDINDDGTIVVRSFSPSQVIVIDAGRSHVLPNLNCADGSVPIAQPYAIGPAGTVVGRISCFQPEYVENAVRWDMTELTIISSDARAYGINRFGTIVGGGEMGAWILLNGEFISLAELSGLRTSSAWVINDRGEILMTGDDVVFRPLDRPGADITADCHIDARDLAVVLADWGLADSVADLDRDGIVGAADLESVLRGWTR
ncbi:MAG: hypothetical protein KDA25_00130 [Phycisphaerales bacterium]|nr:hypothetical protein [Phycisphaerales bacterium]